MALHVTLNVGGKQYLTMRSTLLRYPDSYFIRLFDDTVPPTKNEEGHYLIDRDGEIFRHVLNFLRRGKLVLPDGFSEYDVLKCEAEFYSLDELKKVIKEHTRGEIGLRVGQKTFRITNEEASTEQYSFPADKSIGQKSVPRNWLGNFVIDIEGGVFKFVIRYLQSGGIFFETTPEQLDCLKRDGEFFGLQMLVHHIETVQFMQQQIIKGSSSLFLHLFYHEEDQCVVYANKNKLSHGRWLPWSGSWHLSSICYEQPRYGYNSTDCMFAGLVEKRKVYHMHEPSSINIVKRGCVITVIENKMGGRVTKEHQLNDGWKKVMFSSS